ncbi:growth hormone-regulated TBC protein 1-like protein [Tanacetum coccineum]
MIYHLWICFVYGLMGDKGLWLISEFENKCRYAVFCISQCYDPKKLIRKGIPPVLRPKVWFSLSGVAKKKSTVPDSYYDDLTSAVQDRVTPATKQIDHDLPRTSKLMVQS